MLLSPVSVAFYYYPLVRPTSFCLASYKLGRSIKGASRPHRLTAGLFPLCASNPTGQILVSFMALKAARSEILGCQPAPDDEQIAP